MFTLVLMLSTTLTAQAPKSTGPETSTPRTATTFLAVKESDIKSTGPETSTPRTAKEDASTPEEALRSFLVAMALKDEAKLRSLTLPNDDFDWLLQGQVVPAEHLEEFKAMMAQMPIRVLKPGDEVTLPRNRKLKVEPSDVTEDRSFLLPEGAPVPTRLRKVEKEWKVDATPIIMGRKAADAARKKAEKAAKPGP